MQSEHGGLELREYKESTGGLELREYVDILISVEL